MIECVCDGCGKRIEHEDANPPRGWAFVQVKVTWPNKERNSNSEWESDSIALCNTCRPASGGDLEADSVKILRAGFDTSPHAASS